jgi:bacteriocin-like protein
MIDLEQNREYTQQEITEDELQAVTGGKEITTGNIIIGSIAGTGAVTAVGGIGYTLYKGNKAFQSAGRVAGEARAVLPR